MMAQLQLTQKALKQDTPCANSKRFLQSLISCNVTLDPFSNELENNNFEQDLLETDDLINNFDLISSFKDWALSILTKCETQIIGIEGEFDNAQYIPELVPLVVNSMKLFPCWSSIMVGIFGYGEKTASSSRIESNLKK